jgi:hypothetical protein
MKAAARLLPCSLVDLGGRGRLGLQRVLAGTGGDPWQRRSRGSGSGATPAGSRGCAARAHEAVQALARARAPDPASSSQDVARVTASGCRFMSSAQVVGPSPMLRTSTEVGDGARLGRARCLRRPPANLRLEELALLDGGQLDLLAGGGLRSLPTGFPAPPQSGPEVLTSTASHPC